jgi:hypothetical protein
MEAGTMRRLEASQALSDAKSAGTGWSTIGHPLIFGPQHIVPVCRPLFDVPVGWLRLTSTRHGFPFICSTSEERPLNSNHLLHALPRSPCTKLMMINVELFQAYRFVEQTRCEAF